MKKSLALLAVVGVAAIATAAWYRTAYWNSDAYVDGANVSSNSGYVNVQWTGYVTNYTPGRSSWRIKVWDGSFLKYNETFAAYSGSTNYSRNYYAGPGRTVRVELYCVSNQYTNTPNPSTHVCTYLWIQPI